MHPNGLYRVVVGSSGELEVGRHLPGRGAWLCAGSKPCAGAALRKGALARALRIASEGGEIERLALLLERHDYDPPRGAAPDGAYEQQSMCGRMLPAGNASVEKKGS